jgi:organic radical activating enzyme
MSNIMQIETFPNKIKRFVTVHIPVSVCNFRCPYCYIPQLGIDRTKINPFVVSPQKIASYFSPQRMGGYCYFNLCGNGETMLHPELIELVSDLTKEGHYCDIITNGTQENKFVQLLGQLSTEQQAHLFVKFSFHYSELNRTKMMPVFLRNVELIKKSRASYSIEITPYDNLIDKIDEIKKFSITHFGALPHITVARNEATPSIELLSKLDRDEYSKTWGTFNSALFNFKFSIFNQKRCEFCYAGLWSIEVDLSNGIYKQCYVGDVLGNITNDKQPVHFKPIGRCREPHCFNGHAFLAFGDIPELICPTYAEERDRTTVNGEHWLKKECQDFFSTRVFETNTQLSSFKKKRVILLSSMHQSCQKIRKRFCFRNKQ